MNYFHLSKRLFFICLLSFCTLRGYSEQSYIENGLKYHPAPLIPFSSLKLHGVEKWRQNIIKKSLEIRAKERWPRYVFGSADPANGGFDCSGAMYYLLKNEGFRPERTSSNQYLWLKKRGKVHQVSKKTDSLSHKDFSQLKPADLVFWSGTYSPTDGRTIPITHVGMYIGYMQGYERPLMICASKGRSFNGVRCDGYGVYDFKIPSLKSKAKIVAYGSLPKR